MPRRWCQGGGLSCLPGRQRLRAAGSRGAVSPWHAASRRSWRATLPAGSRPPPQMGRSGGGPGDARARQSAFPPTMVQSLTNSVVSNESCHRRRLSVIICSSWCWWGYFRVKQFFNNVCLCRSFKTVACHMLYIHGNFREHFLKPMQSGFNLHFN